MTNDGDDDEFKAYARNTDPETSHDAADSFDPDDIRGLERRVLLIIKQRGGATWDEIFHALNEAVPKASISPRFAPMRERGLIEWRSVPGLFDLPDNLRPKIKRPGDSGKGQIVWFPK